MNGMCTRRRTHREMCQWISGLYEFLRVCVFSGRRGFRRLRWRLRNLLRLKRKKGTRFIKVCVYTPRATFVSPKRDNLKQSFKLSVHVFTARSMKGSGIGRLLVTILEATELKAAKPNGEHECTKNKSSAFFSFLFVSLFYTFTLLFLLLPFFPWLFLFPFFFWLSESILNLLSLYLLLHPPHACLLSFPPAGKSNPYCEVTMGAQIFTSRVINDTLNPKWNFNCQFHIKDIYQDVLCIAINEKDQFSPDG